MAVRSSTAHLENRLGLISLSEDYSRIRVPIVDSNPDEQRRLEGALNASTRMLAPNIVIDVVDSHVSLGELRHINEAATNIVRAKGFDGWAVGIDVDKQAISVSVDDARRTNRRTRGQSTITKLRADLRQAAHLPSLLRRGADIDSLFTVDVGQSERLNERQLLPHYPANWVEVQGGCTAGFLMRRNNGDLRGTTAGHCGNGINQNVNSNGNFVGTTVANTFVDGTRSDALAYTVPGHTGWNFIQAFDNGNGWIVSAEIVESQPNVWVCHSGRTLWANEGVESSCGSIKLIDLSLEFDGIEDRNLDCAEDKAYPGDSGAPVWNWGDANGVWAAGNVNISHSTGAWWWKKWYTCYHPLSDVRAALGYSLVTH